MSQSDDMTPAAWAAIGFEGVLILCGLWLTWRLFARPAARAAKAEVRLAEWRVSPIDFASFLCFAFVGATALSGAAGLIVRHVRMSSDAATIVGSAVMEGGLLVGLAGYYLMARAQMRGETLSLALVPSLRGGLVTFLVAMPLVFAASNAWEFALVKMGLPDEKQELVSILANTGSVALRWLFVAIATILVPAAEELLFRAGLFRYLRTRVPRWAAIGFTSVLFGALHVAWGDHMAGLPSLLPLIVLAVVFCLAYERTGTIGTTIVAHACFNLNTMLLVATGMGS